MSNLITRLNAIVLRFENLLFGRFPFPPSEFYQELVDSFLILQFLDNFGILAIENLEPQKSTKKPFSLQDLIGDGIFWAVPKHRRTVEKRLSRKFGDPYYTMKTLKVKNHLRICDTCGHHHEVGVLCAHCYDKIRKETELIKEKISAELKLDPVDKEVVVLYDGEKGQHVS